LIHNLINKLFKVFIYYVFKIDLNNFDIESNKLDLDIEHFKINSSFELKALTYKKYFFNNSPIISGEYIKKKNVKLYLYFINKKLVHASCYAEKKPIVKILKKFQSSKNVFIGPVHTDKEYRGKNIHVFDMISRCSEYKSKGFKNIYGDVKSTNSKSIFCFMSIGAIKYSKIKCYKFLNYELYKDLNI
tara:strand:- start:24387 stop:24950 length:564 start_codon:yes stop_codon:yes gene_type:complete